MSLLSLCTQVLRDPRSLVEQNDSPAGLARLAPSLLLLASGGAALFGAVAGSYRGGIQTFYAAIKFPIFLLIPLLLCLPAIHALWRACELPVGWQRLGLASLVGMARAAILLAAAGPLLWLIYSIHIDYHVAIILMVATLGLVGLPGVGMVVRLLPGTGMLRPVALMGSVAILGLVMAQGGWLLRPFVARPAGEVTLLRTVEEDVFSSLGNTMLASLGAYQDWEPAASGVIGRGAGNK